MTIIFIVSEPIYRWWLSRGPQEYEAGAEELDSLAQRWAVAELIGDTTEQVVERFPFDPNKVTSEQLILLGLPEFLSTRLVAYRQKGGTFRVKRDLLKIYGMDSALYRSLHAYIELPDVLPSGQFAPAARRTENGNDAPARYEKRVAKSEPFDLNLADSLQFEQVRGIGPKLAQRIIRYRNALGGYVSREQLEEVYGLDSIAINELWKRSFVSSGFDPTKIDLNTATERELSAHPYIKAKKAGAIVAYRFQHGKFTSEAEIRNIPLFAPAEIERLLPYLKVSP